MAAKFFGPKKKDPDQKDIHEGPELTPSPKSPISPLKPEPKINEPAPNTPQPFPPRMESKSEILPRAGAPIATADSVPPIRESITVLGKDIFFKGELRGSGSVKIDGQFSGSIILDKELTILKNGKVEADVEATIVIIEGHLIGNVSAREKVIISEEGRLVGDIKTEKIAVEEGAVVKGRIEITKFGKSKQTPKPEEPLKLDKELSKQPKKDKPDEMPPLFKSSPSQEDIKKTLDLI